MNKRINKKKNSKSYECSNINNNINLAKHTHTYTKHQGKKFVLFCSDIAESQSCGVYNTPSLLIPHSPLRLTLSTQSE